MTRDRQAQRDLRILKAVFCTILCAAAAFYGYQSIHWRLVWDPAIMHYATFLMDHGMAPYRDILDVDLPGSFLMEGWAMHVFGAGDLGWRFYDFFLLAVLIGSLMSMAHPTDWFAGLYAGVIFLLIHGMEGSRNAGQREQVMITLIIAGYALLFQSVRRKQFLLMIPFGFLVGFAASFKPTAALLGPVLLVMVARTLRRQKVNFRPYVGCGMGGLFLGILPSLNFLYQHRALHDFIVVAARLVPYYAHSGNKPLPSLVHFLLPQILSLPLFIGMILVLTNKTISAQERWERRTLALGIMFGAFSFLMQAKNFEHHLYTFEVFVLFWSALEFTRAIQSGGWNRVAGAASFAFGVFLVVPACVTQLRATTPLAAQSDAIQRDLVRLGGSKLQHEVQCLDMVDGCFTALYQLQLLPSTGFLGDYMFFQPAGNKPQLYYRQVLWDDLHRHPPRVIVMTNMWLSMGFSSRKVDQWPELMAYLNHAYTVDVERSFGPSRYTIYVRREMPATPMAATQPAPSQRQGFADRLSDSRSGSPGTAPRPGSVCGSQSSAPRRDPPYCSA